ncbi:hypothetical protein FIV38_03125 [Pseudomonas proteolytica]|nr:hypothetical protein F4W61_00640 [Pseudomonas proteolytica]QHG26183.1 hypothetical protein GDV60_26275 [Pseudomonas sp. DTU12.1]TWR85514.1 hypothetical protein FIV38_03125 [Pseudomonas proteolytica]
MPSGWAVADHLQPCEDLIVGAGLLAKAVYQSTYLLTDTPLSRASPLPHLTVPASVLDQAW